MAGIVFGCLSPHPPLIVPGVGDDRDKRAVSSTITALEELGELIVSSEPQTIVIVSPHSYYGEGRTMGISAAPVAQGNMREFGSNIPGQQYQNDPALVEEIRKSAEQTNIHLKVIEEKIYRLDWGVYVPMHFLSASLKNVPLVPITFSYLPLRTHFAFGQAIKIAAEESGKNVAFVASGDMSHHLFGSHYGYHAEGKIFDEHISKALSSENVEAILDMDDKLIEQAGECGLRSIAILLGALDGLDVKPRILSYEGPFGVGYLVASFQIK